MNVPIVAEVRRGTVIESVHRGHLCVIGGDGSRIAVLGDPQIVTYLRSAAKPFQAMPFILCGAADEFGFAADEVALACASHSGEPMHTAIAARMLDRIGLSEKDLQCGVQVPFNEAEAEKLIRSNTAPTQLHNNCSGKHAAMLATAVQMGADTDNYLSSFNPIQKAILKSVSTFTGVSVDEIAVGIDGCAAPNFAMPLASMARGFATLVAPRELDADLTAAAARIVAAVTAHPDLIGGTNRLDTMLMKAAPGKFISKVGADGVWLCGVLPSEDYPQGLGIALKIEDGIRKRARPVVAVAILKKLGVLGAAELPDLSPMPITNRRGDRVGSIEATDLFTI